MVDFQGGRGVAFAQGAAAGISGGFVGGRVVEPGSAGQASMPGPGGRGVGDHRRWAGAVGCAAVPRALGFGPGQFRAGGQLAHVAGQGRGVAVRCRSGRHRAVRGHGLSRTRPRQRGGVGHLCRQGHGDPPLCPDHRRLGGVSPDREDAGVHGAIPRATGRAGLGGAGPLARHPGRRRGGRGVFTHIPHPLADVGRDKMASLWHSWRDGKRFSRSRRYQAWMPLFVSIRRLWAPFP